MDCSRVASVFRAMEEEWSRSGAQTDIYRHLASVLAEKGFIVDVQDGLEILEHCRRRKLATVDVLFELDLRVRQAGYQGGTLSMADLGSGAGQLFVFFDPARFPKFAEVRERVENCVR